MKVIITTVGTSIFINYGKDDVKIKMGSKRSDLKDTTIKKLEDSTAKEYNSAETNTSTLENTVKNKWLKGIDRINKEWDISNAEARNNAASAEVASILQIAKGTRAKVYLIASDTAISMSAATLIKEAVGAIQSNITFEIEYIAKLQVKNKADYENEALPLLIERLKEIKDVHGHDEVILNISGGYKAIIPIMTLAGQLYGMPINYTYEDSGELIEVGQLPINFDLDLGEAISYALDNNVDTAIRRYKQLKRLLVDDYKLVICKDGKYERSIISKLYINYVREKSVISKTNLGLILEYLLFHYFTKNNDKFYFQPKKEDLELFYKFGTEYEFYQGIRSHNDDGKIGDIDLVLRRKSNNKHIVLCEIKSRNAITGLKSSYYYEQIKSRIEGYYHKYNVYPSEFLFIVYQAWFFDEKINFGEDVKKSCNKFKKLIEQDYGDNSKIKIEFKARGLVVNLKITKKSSDITYTDLLHHGFENPEFIDII